MKCILCDTRKGKRYCPAKNTQICAQCCGEKRVIEVNCPADCVYLTSGQAYHTAKKTIARLRNEEDPLRRKRLYKTLIEFGDLLSQLEATVVSYSIGLRSLKDRHVLEAFGMLKETYITEKKGVIYERSSADPLVQSLFQALRKFLEETKSEIKKGPSFKLEDILDCLEVLEGNIHHQINTGSEVDAYLRFIKKNHPDVVLAESSRGNLIS